MSSNLKRTKVYFLVVACFVTCVVVLCSYKVGLTERVYKFQDTNLHFRIPILSGHVSLRNKSLTDIRSILQAGSQKYVNVTLDIINHIGTINSSSPVTKPTNSVMLDASVDSPTYQGAIQSNTKKLNESLHNFKTEKYIVNTRVKSSTDKTEAEGIKIADLAPININKTTNNASVGHSYVRNNGSEKLKNNVQQSNVNVIQSFKHSKLSPDLRSPDHFNSYLLKLGLPRQDLSEFGGTVRPDSCKNCFKNDFKLILNSPDLCQGEVTLLIMISSTISNRGSREAIRTTWGKSCNKKNTGIKCLFLFGVVKDGTKNDLLAKESKKYQDIIQHDFIDTYANLTYKTLTAMKWVEEFCPNADFVMKTDDDMFVNTELLPTLLEAAPTEGFVGGVCWGPSPPHRQRQSKWYVSFQQYSRSTFPSMCSGTGYVMSSDVVTGVLEQSQNMPFFYLEDVYVALCLKKLGIRPVLLQGFYHTFVKIEPCNYKNRVITSHGPSQYDLYSIWEGIQNCEKEDRTPESLYLPRPY